MDHPRDHYPWKPISKKVKKSDPEQQPESVLSSQQSYNQAKQESQLADQIIKIIKHAEGGNVESLPLRILILQHIRKSKYQKPAKSSLYKLFTTGVNELDRIKDERKKIGKNKQKLFIFCPLRYSTSKIFRFLTQIYSSQTHSRTCIVGHYGISKTTAINLLSQLNKFIISFRMIDWVIQQNRLEKMQDYDKSTQFTFKRQLNIKITPHHKKYDPNPIKIFHWHMKDKALYQIPEFMEHDRILLKLLPHNESQFFERRRADKKKPWLDDDKLLKLVFEQLGVDLLLVADEFNSLISKVRKCDYTYGCVDQTICQKDERIFKQEANELYPDGSKYKKKKYVDDMKLKREVFIAQQNIRRNVKQFRRISTLCSNNIQHIFFRRIHFYEASQQRDYMAVKFEVGHLKDHQFQLFDFLIWALELTQLITINSLGYQSNTKLWTQFSQNHSEEQTFQFTQPDAQLQSPHLKLSIGGRFSIKCPNSQQYEPQQSQTKQQKPIKPATTGRQQSQASQSKKKQQNPIKATTTVQSQSSEHTQRLCYKSTAKNVSSSLNDYVHLIMILKQVFVNIFEKKATTFTMTPLHIMMYLKSKHQDQQKSYDITSQTIYEESTFVYFKRLFSQMEQFYKLKVLQGLQIFRLKEQSTKHFKSILISNLSKFANNLPNDSPLLNGNMAKVNFKQLEYKFTEDALFQVVKLLDSNLFYFINDKTGRHLQVMFPLKFLVQSKIAETIMEQTCNYDAEQIWGAVVNGQATGSLLQSMFISALANSRFIKIRNNDVPQQQKITYRQSGILTRLQKRLQTQATFLVENVDIDSKQRENSVDEVDIDQKLTEDSFIRVSQRINMFEVIPKNQPGKSQHKEAYSLEQAFKIPINELMAQMDQEGCLKMCKVLRPHKASTVNDFDQTSKRVDLAILQIDQTQKQINIQLFDTTVPRKQSLVTVCRDKIDLFLKDYDQIVDKSTIKIQLQKKTFKLNFMYFLVIPNDNDNRLSASKILTDDRITNQFIYACKRSSNKIQVIQEGINLRYLGYLYFNQFQMQQRPGVKDVRVFQSLHKRLLDYPYLY